MLRPLLSSLWQSRSSTKPVFSSPVNWSTVTFEDPSSQLALRFEADRPARPARSILRVSQLVAEARSLVEQSLGNVWVEGEISNFRPSSAGHLYFTLKDEAAQLSVVLFRRQALLLRFRPEDGLAVRVRGAISIYEQRGQLQLVGETMEPAGVGSLQLAFEQLRERLRAEGLFDAERKRPLPPFPRTVALVTSPTGAVIRDFLQIARRRHAALDVLVVPVAVQGDSAAAEIETALRRLADPALSVDLIVLARGGGSLEDMAAFNSERVARSIAASPLPVVSAIGHETDFTIADFVADLRAPTPSAAAELVTASLANVADRVFELHRRLERAARFQLLQARQHFAALRASRIDARFTAALGQRQQRLDDLSAALDAALSLRLRQARLRLEALAALTLRRDPQRQLSTAREQLASLRERLQASAIRCSHASSLAHRALAERLDRTIHSVVEARRQMQAQLQLQLAALSPLAVLERGYALVQAADGTILRDSSQLQPNQLVHARLGKGSFISRVEEVQAATVQATTIQTTTVPREKTLAQSDPQSRSTNAPATKIKENNRQGKE